MDLNYKHVQSKRYKCFSLEEREAKIVHESNHQSEDKIENIQYLQRCNSDSSLISFKILKYIFHTLSSDDLYSLSSLITNILQILIADYMPKRILDIIQILEILYEKQFELIDWTYIYFLQIPVHDFNYEGKKQILQFYFKHDLLSIFNINSFFHISEEFDILIMKYFISSMNSKKDLRCMEFALNEFINQMSD